MKYSKVYSHPEDGKFYVMMGAKKFIRHTKSDTEAEAKVWCQIESVKYYQRQANIVLTVLSNDENSDLSWDQFRILNTSVATAKDRVEELHQKQPDYDEMDPCTWC